MVGLALSLLPAVGVLAGAGAALLAADLRGVDGPGGLLVALLPWVVPGTVVGWLVVALLVLVVAYRPRRAAAV